MTARRLDERERAHVVGLHEGAGPLDGVVHVALRRKMNHAPDVVFRKQPLHECFVADVSLHEDVIGHAFAFLQIVKIARVGELVEIDDTILRVFRAKIRHEVGADEPGAAGDEYGFHCVVL